MTRFAESSVAVVAWTLGLILLGGCSGPVPAPTSYTAYNARAGACQCDCPADGICVGSFIEVRSDWAFSSAAVTASTCG